MLCDDEHHIVGAFARDSHIRQNERLAIDIPIHGAAEQFSECVGIDVGQG